MAEPFDPLSPEASPGTLATRFGGRRVNNLPLYLVGGAFALFLGIMATVAAERAAQQNPKPEVPQAKDGDTALFAREIAGGQKAGIVPAAVPQAPVQPQVADEAVLSAPLARPENLELPPQPPNTAPDRSGEDWNRIRLAKLQQFEEAVKARTGVPVVELRSRASAPSPGEAAGSRDETLAKLAAVRQQLEAARRDDPTAAYQARLQQMQTLGLAGGSVLPIGLPPPAPPSYEAGRSKDFSQFAGQGSRWRLDAQPEPPRTPYELRAGFVIPATLISGINADLPGQIMAQVSQHVYDTPTGKHLLIPQGTRLVGAYSSEVAYGQSRVLVAWQRIVFPDGKAMDIGAMPGADNAGYAGFNDRVNNHLLRVFGSALLLSAVTAGVTYSQDRNNSGGAYGSPTAGNALSVALGYQLGQATAQMIAKNLNIAPTLEIRPGFRFNVMVVKDLTFTKPYRAFDY